MTGSEKEALEVFLKYRNVGALLVFNANNSDTFKDKLRQCSVNKINLAGRLAALAATQRKQAVANIVAKLISN